MVRLRVGLAGLLVCGALACAGEAPEPTPRPTVQPAPPPELPPATDVAPPAPTPLQAGSAEPPPAFFGENACRRALCADSPRCCQTWTAGCDGALLRIAYTTAEQQAKTGRCYYHDRATCPTCACAYYVKVDGLGFDGGTGCLDSREATVATLLEACGLGRCG